MLFSCTSNGESSSANNENISGYIDQNGDYSSSLSSYSSLPSLNPSSFISKAEKGITSLFIDASVNCSHCVSFEPICLAALVKTGFYMESLYKDGTIENAHAYEQSLSELQSRYGDKRNGGGIDGSTPSIYLGEKDKLALLDFYDDSENTNKFSSYLNSLFTKSEIYHFSSFSSFESKYEENDKSTLVLFIDETDDESLAFYAKSLYPLAKISERSLFYVDIARLDETSKTNFAAYFSLSSLSSCLISEDKIIDYAKNEAEAASFIENYYS